MNEMEEMHDRAVEVQMEAMKAVVADLPSDLGKIVGNVVGPFGVEEAVIETQMEAVKVLVGDFPNAKGDDDKKGKGITTDDVGTSCVNVDDDDWGDDELLYEGDSK
ncbi:unnamed protein product [Urochloa humidicola]